MDDYITKPIDFRVLARKIGQWGGAAGPSPPVLPPPLGKSATKEAVLDLETVAQLRTLVSEARPRFLTDLVDRYANDARTSLDGLKRAAELGDDTVLRDLSHALKGSSRAVGASRVGHLCAALERLERPQERSAVRELLGLLEPALLEAIAELTRAAATSSRGLRRPG
jgi:HPt (histidine-containing phosphotransfer) domain-containing protein